MAHCLRTESGWLEPRSVVSAFKDVAVQAPGRSGRARGARGLSPYRCWRPTPDETAQTAVAVLIGLFLIHGPPLVLKLDNGSAYRAEAMQKALVGYGVVVLYSPAYTPEYNGSAEAGV